MKKIFAILTTCLLLASCADFTEMQPKGMNLLSTVDELELLLNAEFEGPTYDMRRMCGDMIAYDNVLNVLAQPTPSRYSIILSWDESKIETFNDLTASDSDYSSFYGFIGRVANPILDRVETATGDEAKKNQLRAEAYTLRAWSEYILVNKFAKGEVITGDQTVEFSEGGILWRGTQYRELNFTPQADGASFSLHDVTIGVNFHWERKETQVFEGTLHLVVEADKIVAINQLSVEKYLTSVISSEMSATSSLEFLKAHAVISRSWLLAQMEKRQQRENGNDSFFSFIKKDDEIIRWYDREDHTIFGVCADDHCQRYQGITKASNAHVVEAINATRGQILAYGDEICDARFSKCCGGETEEFQYCWEDTPKPYLVSFHDPYCNTNDKHILSQVLNDFDQETPDFYRWTVEYTQVELSELVNRKLKDDFGEITDLIPIARGKSGRIWKLKIVGTKKTLTIGKELEIRRALSETHLYSSAFDVTKEGDKFILNGKGWGHGVGLCQIGAAVMGEQGKTYDEILLFYYRNAQIEKLYE